MGQYPLAIPEKEIVKKFNALVSPILRTISLHQEEINKLNEMKPLLLSKMGV
jgi:restriction endonuclease S subunit